MISQLKPLSRVSLYFMTIMAATFFGLIRTGKSQREVDAPRPFLEFLCPSYPVPARRKMSLQAEIEGARETMGEESAKRIGYKWSASGAKIVSGLTDRIVTIEPQRTPLQQEPFNVDLTIGISGVPPVVENERTCSIRIDPTCKPPRVFARYHKISLKDEDVILESLAKHLMGYGSREAAYIVVYSGLSACAREAEWRADRAQKYLVDARKVAAERVFAVNGGFRDKLTVEIFTSPVGSCGPFPTPNRLPSSARISGFCQDKYAGK